MPKTFLRKSVLKSGVKNFDFPAGTSLEQISRFWGIPPEKASLLRCTNLRNDGENTEIVQEIDSQHGECMYIAKVDEDCTMLSEGVVVRLNGKKEVFFDVGDSVANIRSVLGISENHGFLLCNGEEVSVISDAKGNYVFQV